MKKKCLLFMFLAVYFSASATSHSLSATINGAQEVPANGSVAIGSMTGYYNDVTNILSYRITYAGLADITAAHFHGNAAAGSNAGVKANIGALPSPIVNNVTVAEADESAMLAGMWYINIHTSAFPGGEIRGQVAATSVTHILSAVIDGAQEVPASGSAATGSMIGTYNTTTNVLSYAITYSGLADITAAHFHGNAAAGANAGVKANIGALSSPIVGTVTVAEADESAMLGGMWYINIHTSAFGGGEIRGQVAAMEIVTYSLTATINGTQEVPANASTATGSMTGNYDNSTNILSYSITYSGLADITAAHFHGNALAGANAGVKASIGALPSTIVGNVTVLEADEAPMLAGMWYINIHTTAFGGGEIRGQVGSVSLAADLLTFTAVPLGQTIRLDWQTASEINNKGFKILHSEDSKHWETLDFIPSKGRKGDYSFMHENPIGTTHYYRLIIEGTDGKMTTSKIVSVRMGEKNKLSAFPTTAAQSLTIIGDVASEYTVVDLFGRQILRGYLSANQTVVNVSTLVSGTYFVVTKEASVKFFKL